MDIKIVQMDIKIVQMDKKFVEMLQKMVYQFCTWILHVRKGLTDHVAKRPAP